MPFLNPPSAVKAHALDQGRMRTLQQVDFEIKNYYRLHQALPDRLDVIENKDSFSESWNWSDPVTHQSYEYDVLSKTPYQLCADFCADSEREKEIILTYSSTTNTRSATAASNRK